LNHIELCRKLTAIDSSTSHGTRDIAVAIAELATSWGFLAEVESEVYGGIDNASVVIRPQGADTCPAHLLLSAHLDTDDPGEYASWVHTGANPFNASLDGDYLYGLGVADAKADLACKLIAMHDAARNKFAERAPIFAGTFGLSSGMGALRLIRKKKLPTTQAIALVSGPTGMQIANTGAGYAKVEVSIPFSQSERRYRSDHIDAENSISQSKIFTRPNDKQISFELYDNPIIKLIEYIKQLPEGITLISADGGASSTSEPDSAYLEFDIQAGESDGVTSKLIRMGETLVRLSADLKSVSVDLDKKAYSSLTLGTLRTYPDDIKLSGVCRLVPTADRSLYDIWLENFRKDCEKIGAQFRLMDFKAPFANADIRGSIAQIREEATRIGTGTVLTTTLGCTDANVFTRFGIESYVFGPGEFLELPQPAQEKISILDMQRAEDFYKNVIRRICK